MGRLRATAGWVKFFRAGAMAGKPAAGLSPARAQYPLDRNAKMASETDPALGGPTAPGVHPNAAHPIVTALRRAPAVLARITGEKLFCGRRCVQNRCKKTRRFKPLPRSVTALRRPRTGERKGRNSGAKSDNRGRTGWIRQCGSIPHVPHLLDGESGRIGCAFGNIFVGCDCADHPGRPPVHERPQAARLGQLQPGVGATNGGLRCRPGRPTDRDRLQRLLASA
jgi:hypothetical protein